MYQAPHGYLRDLERELVFREIPIVAQKENLILTEGKAVDIAWAEAVWRHTAAIEISSIGDGIKKLRALCKDWLSLPGASHRRAHLVADKLSSPRPFVYSFPPNEKTPSRHFGQFTLWQDDLIYASTDILGGRKFDFHEDKTAPSRAYLKLWEALIRHGRWPAAGDRTVDLGASPGGWTHVLAKLGAKVLAIDRSELDVHLMNHPMVEFKKGDAFSMTPARIGNVDWLFSDVICYPDKLLEFLSEWIAKRAARNIIATIKFQGDSDPKVIAEFQKLGAVSHLYNNKHELTFFWTFQ
jgi:23S rRNA (cytidine2498-2'-O)-methyltransferase